MAKSPVYGRGRNRKHRAKGGPTHGGAGNVNMKGKKEISDFCWCCVCIDMRDKMIEKEHKKEMEVLND